MIHLAVKIPVIESEKDWGRKVDDHMVCLSNEDAIEFKKEFNAKNNLDATPDWYMSCEGEPTPIDLTSKQYKILKANKRVWLSTLKNSKN